MLPCLPVRVAPVVRLSVVAIAVAATVVRILGLWYGLPDRFARPDEEIVVGHAVDLAFPDKSNFKATDLLYTHTAVTGIPIRPDVGMVFPYPDLVYDIDAGAMLPWRSAINSGDVEIAYKVCRVVGVICGVATAVATFFAALYAYGRLDVAAAAGLLLALNFLHARDSHYATVDVPLSLFVTMALAFALKAASTRERRHVWLSAAGAGLAASAKYNGAIAILPAIVVEARAFVRPDTSSARRRVLTTLIVAAAVMIAAFALTSPWCLRHYQLVSLGLKHQREVLFGSEGPAAWRMLFGTTLPNAFGWPGFAVVVAAIGRALWKRRVADILLLVFVVPTFLSMAGMTWVLPRYPILLLPALCVMAAETALSLPARLARIAMPPLFALMTLFPLFDILAYDLLASMPDTRLQASEWMHHQPPPPGAVAVCRGYGAPEFADRGPLPPQWTIGEVPCTLDAIQALHPRVVVTHDHPYVKWFGPSDDVLSWLKVSARPVAVFSPFVGKDAESGMARCFAAGDVFYLPSCGFDHVDRGGPIITIWDLSGR